MSNLREVLNTWDNADSELNKKIDNTNLSSIVASATASATNSKTVEINGTGKAIEKLVLEGRTAQNGTPSPDNPIEVKGVGDYDEETGKYKIPISSGGKSTNIYLNEPLFDGEILNTETGIIERKSNMINFTGDENWSLQSINSYGIANFKFVLQPEISQTATADDLFMNTFPRQYTAISSTKDEGFVIMENKNLYLRIKSSTVSTVDAFKTWLKNNPTTIIYPSATPTKETFDGAEIPTSVGKNTLTVGTEVIPSKVEAVTFGDYYSKSQIDKMFADIHADMAAMAELL